MNKIRNIFALLCLLAWVSAWAAEVHVVTKKNVGGTVTQLGDAKRNTGETFETVTAPSVDGYIFTGWTIQASQSLVSRDIWGRSLDSVSFTVYEETTVIANYVASSVDADADGIPDGSEQYWYGDFDKFVASDTDGDGFGLSAELALGLNPLMSDRKSIPGVVTAAGATVQYNPDGIFAWKIRSEPEGQLFATQSDYAKAGTVKTTSSCSPANSNFAYWTVDGVPQRDMWGRALEQVTFTMGTNATEVVAVCVADEEDRKRLYWYGTTDVDMNSDTDGDGFSFAAELAMGLNPLVPDRKSIPGVVTAAGATVQYNPDGIFAWKIRSEPEGQLFATQSDYAKAGTVKTTGSYSPANSNFAYWTVDGVPQRDMWGRALEQVTFTMGTNSTEVVAVCISDEEDRNRLYWYGTTETDMNGDTDGDGLSLAVEQALGLNPLMPDRKSIPGVVTATGTSVEVNLQIYEQLNGAVVDDKFANLFYNKFAKNDALTFGNGLFPVVADVNDDGLWDLIVCSATSTNVFINVGSRGNPEFRRRDVPIAIEKVDLSMNSTAKLAEMSLDVEPINALSATTNGNALLVSDVEGRIWYYLFTSNTYTYSLQHKVWGGTYPGFASGLRLAAVDWEDDGDLDCLCGTTDGKLMLLRDPKVGRPTNLQAAAGVDNVKLTWDPNAQSRVRGYKVYRDDGGIAMPTVPNYRDYPESLAPHDYKVSALSRFYTAGNSMPTEMESVASESVHVEFGSVSNWWCDASAFDDANVVVKLAIGNSEGITGSGGWLRISYDKTVLMLVDVEKTGLTESTDVSFSEVDDGAEILLTGGVVSAGKGEFLRFVFHIADLPTSGMAMARVSLVNGELSKPAGGKIGVGVPIKDAEIEIYENPHDAKLVPPYSLGDINGDGRLNNADIRAYVRLGDANAKDKRTPDVMKAADFNGDVDLTWADVLAFAEKMRGLGFVVNPRDWKGFK